MSSEPSTQCWIAAPRLPIPDQLGISTIVIPRNEKTLRIS
ncbi:hypothetical protein RISK_000079 [Rhodopirellula islandica]|uniref:Uncharacterized protein n=1 Tax=Rhodopirellula islandica TaxID=595434 RepID=A0A0J1BN66_RHOIS|nr:hypothetical protein RISK_000079 [Rhodopirellula islandica]